MSRDCRCVHSSLDLQCELTTTLRLEKEIEVHPIRRCVGKQLFLLVSAYEHLFDLLLYLLKHPFLLGTLVGGPLFNLSFFLLTSLNLSFDCSKASITVNLLTSAGQTNLLVFL